jgi:hypothetical protein
MDPAQGLPDPFPQLKRGADLPGALLCQYCDLRDHGQPRQQVGIPQLLLSNSSSERSSMPKSGGTIQSTSILPAAVLIMKDPVRHPDASPRSSGSFGLSGVMSQWPYDP